MGILDAPAVSIASPLWERRNKNTIVLFGDSITERNRVSTASLKTNDQRGYFTWANILLNQRLWLLNVAGVSGNTTTQMLARITADVLAYAPGWCVVQGGHNDIVGSASHATIVANLTTIYQTLLKAGIRVVATTITPYNSDTVGQNVIRNSVNRWMREYALSTPGIVLCDWAAYVADPDDNVATSYWIPTYSAAGGSTSQDGIHPAALGAARMGRRLYQVLDPVVPKFSNLPDFSSDPANIIPSGRGFLIGNAAGVATGWSMSGSGHTPTKVARTDLLGNGDWQQVANASGADSNVRYADLTTGFSVGDNVYAEVEFQTDVFTNCTVFYLGLLFIDAGSATIFEARDCSVGVAETWPLESQPLSGVFRTPTTVIPALTTKLRPFVRMAGQGTFRIARFQVRKAGL